MINWTEVIIAICTTLITAVIVPIAFDLYKTKISKEKRATIEHWTEVGVRWAKQWMQTEEGKEKKKAVMDYLEVKMEELGIAIDQEDLDKIIEAVYERVKEESRKPSAT